MNEILLQINMGVKFDSENVYYLSYKGRIETLNLYMSLMTGKNVRGHSYYFRPF